MALTPADNLGKHKLRSIEDIPDAPGDPGVYLSGDKQWRRPSDTADLLRFTAASPIAANQAAALRDDGLIELASSALVTQRGRYAGIATGPAAAGETAFCQMVGLCGFPLEAFTPGEPVFVGPNGGVTQIPPFEGWRQRIGFAVTATSVLLSPGPVVVCLASSDSIPRPGGEGGGSEEIRWATVQEVKDGTLPYAAVSPATLHPYIDDMIAQYGLTAARKATTDEIRAGTPDKAVMAQQLKPLLDELTGGQFDYATSADIRAGTSGTKLVTPLALKPIYDELRAMDPNLVYATAADIEAGVNGTAVISPLAFGAVLNRLDAMDRALADAIPAAAVQADIEAGTALDKYVSPAMLKLATDGVAGLIPAFATLADFTANSTNKIVSPADANRLYNQLYALIPAAATAAEVAAGTAADKYVSPRELKEALGGLDIANLEAAISGITSRVLSLELLLEGYEKVVWATEAEVLEGTAVHKAIDPFRLAAKVADLGLEGAYATLDEVRSGIRGDVAVSPAMLSIVLREQTPVGVDEFGGVFPLGVS